MSNYRPPFTPSMVPPSDPKKEKEAPAISSKSVRRKGKVKASDIKSRLDQLNLPEKSKKKAIALKYDVDKGKAPKILAVGKGAFAEMILQVAEDHKIPFYEDDALADLLSKLEIDSEIPPELFGVVAEVLAFVYQLDKLAKKRQKVRDKYGTMRSKEAL